MEELKISLSQYSEQLSLVSEALTSAKDDNERQPLLELKGELQQLIQLTQESLDATISKETEASQPNIKPELDDEYALFMKEMAQTGAYDSNDQPECSSSNDPPESKEDIEDELASLLGMKCAVYHTHRWGGEPSLHNAMVSSVEPRQDDDQFQDLQVRVLFTHPTHAEMLPCPFYLNGECKFDDTQCRYSHGNIFHLSELKDAIAPDFESIKVGSRVLLKLKPPEDDDISLTKKSSEKYHLWHRAIVKSLDVDEKSCIVRLEHGINTGGKRKAEAEDFQVKLEDIVPLNVEGDSSSDSEESLSDTEYPDCKNGPTETDRRQALLVEKSLLTNAPSMGDWERHTRGIGSKLMLAMGYVPGTGLGAAGDGRLAPVEARQCPVGKSLDHCMEISERHAGQDPLKVEQKLKRLQKKEEDRNKRAYEREKERERRNVFNFLNRTLGDKSEDVEATPVVDIKATTSKHLNIEQFKITEDLRKTEKEILRLNSYLERHAPGTTGHRTINSQIVERNKELNALRQKEQQIVNEQIHRKDKKKMTVF